jgi:hypothetical protein
MGFSHAYYGAARHAITVGFVSLMIVGVAAKVVPTLNGVNVKRLSALWAPFVLLNAGCALRVIGQTWTDFSPSAFPFAGVSGVLEVAGLALWGVHLWLVMAGRPRLSRCSEVEPKPESLATRSICATDSPAAVLDVYPELLPTFVEHGFGALEKPWLRATLGRAVTIGEACHRTGISDEQFLTVLNQRRAVAGCGRGELPLVSLDTVRASVRPK